MAEYIQRRMTFKEAISSVFHNYFKFKGRASRSEFWWWTLFSSLIFGGLLAILCLLIIATREGASSIGLFIFVSIIFLIAGVALGIPTYAVWFRRLQDAGHNARRLFIISCALSLFSGILEKFLESSDNIVLPILVLLAILVYNIVLIIYLTNPSDEGDNDYGPMPNAEEVSGPAESASSASSENTGEAASSLVRYCAACGSKYRSGVSFCPECGIAVPQTEPESKPASGGIVKYCAACGSPYRRGVSFCPECGVAVPQSEPVSEAPASSSVAAPAPQVEVDTSTEFEESESSNKKWWIITGGSAIGIAIMLGLAVIVTIVLLLTGADKIPILHAEDYNHIESSKGLDYSGAMAADGNLGTSWQINLNESLPEEGEFGEYDVYGPLFQVNAQKVDYVKLYNGSARSHEAWVQNCRAKKILIMRVNPDEYSEADPSDVIYQGPLKDAEEMQKLKVSPTFDNTRPTNFIQIIYPSYLSDYEIGSYTYDLPLSEFEVYGEEMK